MNIPEGFSEVTPYLFVEDANAFGDFVSKAFGAVEIGRSERDSGQVANLQLKFQQSIIMVSDAFPNFPPMPTALYLYVEDADAAMKQAVEAGAILIYEAQDMDYGDRQGGVQDPYGNYWWLSQRLVDHAYHTD